MQKLFLSLGCLLLCQSLQAQIIYGSNVAMNDLGDYLSDPKSWYGENGKKPVQPLIGTFHLNRAKNIQQLQLIRQSGQEAISLVIWHANLGPEFPTRVHGHLIASNGGQMTPQHSENLIEILKAIQSLGFRHLTVRFALQGGNDPGEWSNWNEERYQENWNFIVSTRNVIVQSARPMNRTFDLGVELGGIPKGQSEAYVRRLYSDYCLSFTCSDTFGFSIAWDEHGWTQNANGRGRIVAYLQNIRKTGYPIHRIAVDLYNQEAHGLKEVRRSLDEFQLGDLPVALQETYYNSRPVAEAIHRSVLKGELQITHVYQWPDDPGPPAHFSRAVPADISNFLAPFVSQLGLGCLDYRCIWLTGLNFTQVCVAHLFAGDWRHGETPIRSIRQTNCSDRTVTFRIPDDIYRDYSSLNIVISREAPFLWSEPRVIQIR